MDIVDSTVGSSICTGWNRRSRAGSLDIVFLYSSANGKCPSLERREGSSETIRHTCGGADKVQRSSSEGRLDHLTGVDGAFCLAEVEEHICSSNGQYLAEYDVSLDIGIRSSSIKQMTSSEASSMSRSNALNLDSNCPLIPDPATRLAKSRERTRLLWRDFGSGHN